MAFINIDGKNIYIEEYGKNNKKKLLYLHGGPGASCLDFQHQAEAFGKTFHIITIDQYGVLRSEAMSPDEKYGMKKQIEMLEQMRIQLNIDKWSLLGHSYGGTLACLYANLFPNSICSVIYECPSFNLGLSAKSVAEYLLTYFVGVDDTEGCTLCKEMQNKTYQENDSVAIQDMINVLALVADQKTRNYLHSISMNEYIASYSTDGISNDMWARSNMHLDKLIEDKLLFSNFLPLLEQNEQPALLITGKYDPVCREDQINYFNTHAPRGRTKEFKNSGHFPRIEEKDEYTKCIYEFLNNCAL